jgi:hypothetical protein
VIAAGLLLSAGVLPADAVSRALDEQGGPPWDQTEFRVLAGVDPASLARGSAAAGSGTAVALFSSGFWFRNLDDLADRLAAIAKVPVLAIFESEPALAGGFHLSTPGRAPKRGMERGSAQAKHAWADGVAALIGAPVPRDAVAALGAMVGEVADDAPELPPIFCFRVPGATASERDVIGEARGTSLVHGFAWKPDARGTPKEHLPGRTRVIVLSGPVRLPGPPRWAVAFRPDAIEIAQQVLHEDGWVTLVPVVNGVPAIYGSAVQVLQFAPVPEDPRFIGVIHPRTAVRVGPIGDGSADVTPVPDVLPHDGEAFDRALTRCLDALSRYRGYVQLDPDRLRQHPDPAREIAWQVPVSPELSQSYLGSGDPIVRLEVLAASIDQIPVTPTGSA